MVFPRRYWQFGVSVAAFLEASTAACSSLPVSISFLLSSAASLTLKSILSTAPSFVLAFYGSFSSTVPEESSLFVSSAFVWCFVPVFKTWLGTRWHPHSSQLWPSPCYYSTAPRCSPSQFASSPIPLKGSFLLFFSLAAFQSLRGFFHQHSSFCVSPTPRAAVGLSSAQRFVFSISWSSFSWLFNFWVWCFILTFACSEFLFKGVIPSPAIWSELFPKTFW